MFGGTGCRVAGCGRTARGRGLCQGHLQRWNNQGRPDMQRFVGSADPRWRRQRPNQQCRVPRCGYGSARAGMCGLHAQRWQRAGRPDLDGWLAEPQPVKQPAAGATCRIPHCRLWPQATSPFCHAHTNTWKVNGRPDVDEFADHFAETPLASEMIRLDRLAPQLKLEMQYVLQRRHDDRQGKLTPDVVMRVVRALADANVSSLLDHDEDTWHERIRWGCKDTRARGLFGYAYRAVADLAEAGGWEAEYPRDVWRMRRLGYEGDRTLRFAAIPQPWLRDLAKRWVRWRLSSRAVPGGRRRQAGRRNHPVRRVPRRHRRRADRPDRPIRAGTLPRRPARRFRLCPTPRHPPRAAQPVLRRHPPTPLGHSPSRRRDVLHRGLPQTRRTAAAGAGRARHGPARAPGQPRPIRRRGPPADHDHPDALRAAGHRRAAAALPTAWSPTPTAHRICATSTTR